MKLLLVHNYYCHSGGEDEVFHRESELLRSAGHEILEYTVHNSDILESGILTKARIAVRTFWAEDSVAHLQTLLRLEKPDLVHFHNTFPLLSPAVYYACQQEKIPVVQSLHNSRLICPTATLYREGRVCEDCLGRVASWPGVVHACYHESRLQTAIVAGMLSFHRLLATWREQVDSYIVFTKFFREKFIAAGLPREKIFIKPHFLSFDPGMKREPGSYALFIGRLAKEKGVSTLLKAWESLSHIPLWVRGVGPMAQEVLNCSQKNSSIRILPYLSRKECFDVIKGATFLIWPSEGYYETFGLAAIEAFACGTPVIASGLGAMAEVVEDKKTGLHFQAGKAEDLAAKVGWAWSHPQEMHAMGRTARVEYQAKYTAERNYFSLLDIYNSACRGKTRELYKGSETSLAKSA